MSMVWPPFLCIFFVRPWSSEYLCSLTDTKLSIKIHSRPSISNFFSGSYALDNVSGSSMSFPHLYLTVRSYHWSRRCIICICIGVERSAFLKISSRGLWSLYTVTWFPKMKLWNFVQAWTIESIYFSICTFLCLSSSLLQWCASGNAPSLWPCLNHSDQCKLLSFRTTVELTHSVGWSTLAM